jgi:hypothetical protein
MIINTTTYDRLNKTMVLFGSNLKDGIAILDRWDMMVFDFKIYDEGQLVRDFIPCFRNSDTECGLFDLVEQKFYTSPNGESFRYEENNSIELRGSGTENDPYLISTADELAYINYVAKNRSTYANKYFELTNDIILNDETFDENGNPSGGDGVIYEWNILAVANLNLSSWNGKGYTIKGLYINQPTKNYASLFGNNELEKVENINMQNVYCSGKVYVCGFAHKVKTLKNCVLKRGTIKGNGTGGYVAGFTYNISILAQKCVNYASIMGKNSSGGITGIAQQYTEIINCKNYGYVEGKFSTGGIVSYSYWGTIRDCANYGHINSLSYFSAGIVGQVHYATTVKNCDNYGLITVSEYEGGACGGIVGVIQSPRATIENCNNYAWAHNPREDTCEIVGYLQMRAEKNSTVLIKNCNGYYGNRRFLGGFHSMEYPNNTIIVENCYFNCKNNYGHFIGGLGKSDQNVKLIIRDTKVDFNGKGFYIVASGELQVEIENMLVEGLFEYSVNFTKSSTFDIKSFIINAQKHTGALYRVYNGYDFSGFSYNRKTGVFGIKSMSATGDFQTISVTEEWLINRNYQKQVI